MPDVSFKEIFTGLVMLINFYLFLTLLFMGGIFFLFRVIKSNILKKTIYALIIFLAVFFAILRIVDWGTIYFSGQHVDNIFWYHAFYIDGTYFFLNKIAAIVISIFILCIVLFSRFLSVFIRRIPEISNNFKAYSKLNCGVFIILIILLNVPIIFASAETENPMKQQYIKIPEVVTIASFIDYAIRPDRMNSATLNKKILAKLKKGGVLINPDEKYPLMKDSIYINPKNRTSNKPKIKIGTNIIIVFLESFNKAFLLDKLHGYHGLTPNLNEVMSQSFSFTNMYNATFPTERGMFAILGSSLYLLDRIKGPHKNLRPPIPCKFYMLSDILKERGYSNYHVQGGSGLFGGLGESFVKRQNYDTFYDWESVELHNHAKKKGNEGWGIPDDYIFDFAASNLKNGKFKEPFLLTINSLDTHPPHEPTHKHPDVKDNPLLNVVHSTDHGFGIFWEYFKNSNFRKNTILIITADHAMGPGTALKKFFASFNYPADRNHDIVPCFILFPGSNPWNKKSNDTLCTSLDVLPSLLDMMDIDVKNPFLGLSIFSERSKYPFTLSEYYTIQYDVVMNKLSPDKRAEVKSIGWTSDDQSAYIDYLKKIVLNRSVYPEEKNKE